VDKISKTFGIDRKGAELFIKKMQKGEEPELPDSYRILHGEK